MIRSVATVLGTTLLLAALVGCGEEEAPKAEPQKETPSASQPSTSDVTTAFRQANSGAPWIDDVTAVEETEPGRLVVETKIVDPRGDDGSPEAKRAVAVCKAAVKMLKSDGAKDPYVRVTEDDGTTFVLYGHPAYPDGCTEV